MAIWVSRLPRPVLRSERRGSAIQLMHWLRTQSRQQKKKGVSDVRWSGIGAHAMHLSLNY